MTKTYGIENPSTRGIIVLSDASNELNKIIKKFKKKEEYADSVAILSEIMHKIDKSINDLK